MGKKNLVCARVPKPDTKILLMMRNTTSKWRKENWVRVVRKKNLTTTSDFIGKRKELQEAQDALAFVLQNSNE